ncbi:MAG: metal-sulfur cluster assembly factor [Myxococcaceae bacterium]|nr:metal-sulfur cluster assembly factor [Myxococcaceae bacterium]
MSEPRDPELLAALEQVIDPEIGLDVVALGLVYRAERDASYARVVMTMTSPACPLHETIVEDARAALAAVPGIERVDVALVFEPPWAPERMSLEAKQRLGWSS